MSARDRLIAKVTFGSDQYEADFLAELDAYRAEVQVDLANWLVKKAHEYQSLRGKENAARVEVLCRMADKIRRGAVRPGFKVTLPDPLAYGPRGYCCGCGKDAHSNLVPCLPEASCQVCSEGLDDENITDFCSDRCQAAHAEAGESRG